MVITDLPVDEITFEFGPQLKVQVLPELLSSKVIVRVPVLVRIRVYEPPATILVIWKLLEVPGAILEYWTLPTLQSMVTKPPVALPLSEGSSEMIVPLTSS